MSDGAQQADAADERTLNEGCSATLRTSRAGVIGAPVVVRLLPWVLATIVLLVGSSIVAWSMVVNLPGVSPIDEWAYIDSLDQASRFDLARPGETISQYARDVISCRRVIGVGQVGAPCGLPQPDQMYPLGAVSPAPIHPPVYFFGTALLARGMMSIGITNDLVYAGRLAGAMWVTLGGLVLVGVVRLWGRPWYLAVLLALALAVTPTAATTIGFLTPDAAFLLSAAIPILGATLWLKGRIPPWTLIFFGAAPVLFKTTHVLATVVVALFVYLLAIFGQPTASRRAVALAATYMIVGAGVALVAWTGALRLLAIAPIPPHPVAEPAATLGNFLALVGYPLQTVPRTSGAPIPLPATSNLAGILMAAIFSASVLGAIVFSRRTAIALAGWSGLTMALLGSLILSSMVFVVSGGFLVGVPRYSLGFLPFLYMPLLVSGRDKLVGILLGAVAATGLVGFALWGLR